MSFVVAVEQIPYRLESQEQTLFEALAQRGGDNRFKGPFGAYQKKWCRDCHLSSKKCSDKLSSKTRKGSSEFRGETPIKWSTFGCLVHKISGGAMKQGIKVPYITFWLKLAAAKQRLIRQMRGSVWSDYQELLTYIFSTTSFIKFDLDRSCLGSAMGRVDSISSTFINLSLWEDIPKSKLGDGRLILGENSLRWGVRCRYIPHRLLQQYPAEFDRNLGHISRLLKGVNYVDFSLWTCLTTILWAV